MARDWSCALVTGASSGIGEAVARRLAAEGTDLVLVARREDRLKELADELRERGVDVQVLAADLADADQRALVEDRLRAVDRPVDLLVNNAGAGAHGRFADLPVDGEETQVQLNVVALVRLTHAALPGMIGRGRGGVIQVSSLGSVQPAPNFATYVGTKAFVTSFSESLHEELRGTGVTVTALLPGFTRTEFQQVAGATDVAVPGFLWMDADAVAADALRAVAAGRAMCIPGPANKAMAVLSRATPRSAIRRISGLVSDRL